jgi:VWFA-related protein
MKVLFLLAIAAAAVLLPAQAPPLEFRAGTRVVEISIIATHKLNKFALRDLLTPPVNDLRAEDLRLFDNGVEQAIASFEKLGQGGASAAGAAALPPQRLSIIVLDCLNTGWVAQIFGRDGVSKMLTRETLKNPPAGGRIAIFALGENLHLLHDLSTDYVSLRAAVKKYEGERPQNGLGSLIPNFRNRILDTFEAMAQIAQLAKSYPGKKTLLWISNGVPAPRDLQKELVQTVRELGGANVTLYFVNPGGMDSSTPDPMDMAEQTGGRTLSNSNDVGSMIRQAMDEAAGGRQTGSYSLTFVPKTYLEDGSFHDLRLQTSRKGVVLHYRTSYSADHH